MHSLFQLKDDMMFNNLCCSFFQLLLRSQGMLVRQPSAEWHSKLLKDAAIGSSENMEIFLFHAFF